MKTWWPHRHRWVSLYDYNGPTVLIDEFVLLNLHLGRYGAYGETPPRVYVCTRCHQGRVEATDRSSLAATRGWA